MASLCTGIYLQVVLVLAEVKKTAPMAQPYLESIHPLFMGHGVIAAMADSGIVLIVVSLVTQPSERLRLVPFFPNEGLAFAATMKEIPFGPSAQGSTATDRIIARHFEKTVYLHLAVEFSVDIHWKTLVTTLSQSYKNGVCISGPDSIQRYGHGESVLYLSSVTLTRGDSSSVLWYGAEGDSMYHRMSAGRLQIQRLCSSFVGRSNLISRQ
ncbi:MAG: hypothetical protein WBB19_03240 [Desulforhopalus sp.]